MGRAPYEVHLTVAFCSLPDLELAVNALGLGATLARVELGGDQCPEQLMVTWLTHRRLAGALREAGQARECLEEQSIATFRVKVECDVADASDGGGSYLEHHALVEVAEHAEPLLAEIAARHGARQSRVPKPKRDQRGAVERFVNQRWWRPNEAGPGSQAFRCLRHDLALHGFRVVRSIEERVLVDTNLSLDGDWLTPASGEVSR